MNLTELFRWCESIVPEADNVILPSSSSTVLSKLNILNEGEREWVKLTKCFSKETKFNCSAGVNSYSLTSVAPDYLDMREEGMWHLRTGSNTQSWWRLKPTTQRYLDQIHTTWRNQSASDSLMYYWQDGNILGTYYTPSSSVTNGFWLYYYATSSQMTTGSDYPFSGASNQTRLEPYHKHLLPFYKSKALELLGYRDDARASLIEFVQLAGQAKSELQERSDLAQDAAIRPKINMPQFRR